MLSTVDVGLMANHLSSHKGVISRLELYEKSANHGQLKIYLRTQIETMKNHVNVMNQLLNTSQNNQMVTLPEIPQGPQNQQVIMNATNNANIGITEQDMLLDAHFTATAMANDNFLSSTNMKNLKVKQIHVEMGMQQSKIAEKYHKLGEQLGWMSHPTATQEEQFEAMDPLMKSNSYMNNQTNIPSENQNPLN